MKQDSPAPITGWIRRDVYPTLYTESCTELALWHDEGADVTPLVPLAAYAAACTAQPDGEQTLPPPSGMLPRLQDHDVETLPPLPMWDEPTVRGVLAVDRIRTRNAALEAAAAICDYEAEERDSDAVDLHKNYAACCAERIRELLAPEKEPA